MSDPATTTETTVTGKLLESNGELIVLGLPRCDYKLHLVPMGNVKPDGRGKVTGVIRAKAKRVDVVETGGCYIEPVFGRPRRVQGRIIGGDAAAGTITVAAAAPLTATLMAPQTIADFALGQLVGFDVERGATFEPMS